MLELTGIDLDQYKRPQMLRRLDSILARCHLANLAALASELKPGSEMLKEFMERFTINVSECFRDRPRFEALQREIIPNLLKRNPGLRIWSAGCSYGAEPYSLAIILRELGATRAQIVASDIDPKILDAARAGESFTGNDFRNLPRELAAKYFTPISDGHFRAADSLRPLITFRQHNLLKPAPAESFDLVLCRNVTIYFTEEAKDQVTERLVATLRPGGVLFIGETETIHRPNRFGLTLRSTSFYERAA
ncbi:MAG: protein-glutamate O-methyltransferase CheR [Ktedonobacterales bacterium]|nr:protein-glutamate O-methyltransferase CheR [Ktedonobacterales bacterium]